MTDDIAPIETNYAGRRFRSRTEARWAVFFEALGWSYDYEREGYDLNGRWYLPDFYLPQLSMWVEVKGKEPTEEEKSLCRQLADLHGQRVAIVTGPPILAASQWILFEPGSTGVSWPHELLQDRRNDGEYWFAQMDDNTNILSCFSIGPVVGPGHDRYPLVREALRDAVSKALSERFDGKA